MYPYNIELIFKEYKNKIYRLALNITRNPKDAEDILQNTVLKIMDNLKKFKGRSKLSTWIYRIAYNESLMHLRKKYRQFRLADVNTFREEKTKPALFINWPKVPDKQLLDREFKERIDSAIKQMPIQYRMALLLHNVEDFSIKDTADIMGLKLNTVKTRIHRSALIIKRELANYSKDRQQKQNSPDELCNLLTGFVYDYTQGYLEKTKKQAFKSHIKDCYRCNLFLDKYLRAIQITKALECQDIPPELQERIKSFLRNIEE